MDKRNGIILLLNTKVLGLGAYMDNPFESGHIKNYVLLYASVVVIMILFFIASTLFHDVDAIERKVFNTNSPEDINISSNEPIKKEVPKKFKLIETIY